MSTALRMRGAGYRYPTSVAPVVADLDLHVNPGEIVLLCGPTGCGKSTALRRAAGLLSAHGAGAASGEVWVFGAPLEGRSPAARAAQLGFVAQEPHDQLICAQLDDELCFVQASLGRAPEAQRQSVRPLLAEAGLPDEPDRPVSALSGGQAQRLVTAAAGAGGARLLLLDEPLSQLDPAGARALMAQLRRRADEGVAVLLVEHRLELCLPEVDRVLTLVDGRIAREDAAWPPGSPALAAWRALGLSLPAELDLADRLGLPTLEALDAHLLACPPPAAPDRGPRAGPPLLDLGPLAHRHPGGGGVRLSGLQIWPGERIALIGGNGAGKSTLLGLLSGRIGGGRRGGPRVVEVPQDPDLCLFHRRVREELAFGAANRGVEAEPCLQAAAAALCVTGLLDRAPQALSRGQRLRVAVAAAWTAGPDLLLLDEPTSGQDDGQVDQMMAALSAPGAPALLFATHDLSAALRYATRALLIHGGELLADGPPDAVLAAIPAGAPLLLPPLQARCLRLGRAPAPLTAYLRPVPVVRNNTDNIVPIADPTVLPVVPPAVLPVVPLVPPVPSTAQEARQSPVDPRAGLAWVGAAGLLALCLERPAGLLLLCLAAGAPLVWGQGGRQRLGRALILGALLVWSTALSQGLFYADEPRSALLTLPGLDLPIYREGLRWGAAQALRFYAMALAGVSLSLHLPAARLQRGLVALGLPAALALMVAAALRALPTLTEELRVVRAARRSRAGPRRRGPLRWMTEELSNLSPVVARAWRRAWTLAESLDARGFSPDAPRTEREPLQLSLRDAILTVFALSIALSAAAARGLFLLYTSELYLHPATLPLLGFVRRHL